MKQASPQLVQLLKQSPSMKALPEVIIDWNLNRYHDTKADNLPSDEETAFEAEIFPIESITNPLRPGKGINKARVGHGSISREYQDVGGGRDARFYVSDVDDGYKYWTSPKPAVGGTIPLFNTSNFPKTSNNDDVETYPDLTGHDGKTSARPSVTYGKWSRTVDSDGVTTNKNFTPGTVKANKIVIRLENTWASPNNFDILIERSNSTQTVSHTALSGWEASGTITLYWNGFSWTQNSDRVDDSDGMPVTDTISAISLEVRTLKAGYQVDGSVTKYKNYQGNWVNTNGSDSFFDLIAIEAHLEANLTPWVIDTSDTIEMSEVSALYPLGTVTSNQASVTLSDLYKVGGKEVPGVFSPDNKTTLWHDYIEPNAEVTSNLIYYSEAGEEIDRVRQFVMYIDEWAGSTEDQISVTLSDYSKFFNLSTPPAAMWEGLKVPEIVWRLLDSVGFTNYVVDRGSRVTEHVVPIFHTDGESSLWEVLSELAKASQTAIYFDSEGILRVRTRDFAMGKESAPVWSHKSYDSPDGLADIISLQNEGSYEPNSIKVMFQKTNWAKVQRGHPTMQAVWEPETETVTLRASELQRNLGVNDRFIWLTTPEVRVWPYEGIVNIQGEFIKYDGKEYVFYSGANGNIRNKTVVRSEDERKAVQRNRATGGYLFKSHFTGGLAIAKDEDNMLERGFWNSDRRRHPVDAEGYSVRHIDFKPNNPNVRRMNVAGFRHLKKQSKVQLQTGPRLQKYNDVLIATRGGIADTAFFHYGTKIGFVKEKGRTTQRAGLVIHNSGNTEDGYYIELTPSRFIDGNIAKNRRELIVYSRKNGKDIRVGGAGRRLAIGENIEYELDVTFRNHQNNNEHQLMVWLNGKMVFNERVSGSNRNTPNGKFGMFARGKTKVRYEFLYGIRKELWNAPEDFSFLDKVQRANVGARWDRDWVFEWRKTGKKQRKRTGRARKRFNKQFFDDFGPYVQEVREFEVKFDPAPVLHSRLYMTNDWGAINTEYSADPFGAKFVIANTARHNSVVHGDDALSFAGTGESVAQTLTVLGRALEQSDAEEILAENVEQVRRRGKIESELSSPWIQSKSMANDLAKWIRENWTYGNETVRVEIFGNPLIEVGDVVSVDYPEKHVSGDFFVVATSNGFSNGLTTSLTLRKRI